MQFKKKLLIFLIACGTGSWAYSQEQLSSVLRNPVPKESRTTQKSGAFGLQLPFIEDFSGKSSFPDPEKWEDSFGYVNSNYAINSPGIGVVSLDALDSTGAVYARATVSSFQADRLTSKPINLDIGGDTTLYLSFYFQPEGLGDRPEAQDSLILEFFAPLENKWVWIWSTPGLPQQEFQQVLIPVRGAIFLKNGFQFRFRNLASLADAYEPSLMANADHWHLDYIYLNRNRNYQDYAVNDLTIQSGPGSLLLNYRSIPWEHFRLAGINEVKTIFNVHLKNLSDSRKYFEPVFTISDDYGSGSGFSKNLFADEVQAFQELHYDATFNYGFNSTAVDSARFTVKLNLNPTEKDLIPENSEFEFVQEFTNYYAYDDETAEAGYGITGEGANNALVAIRYQNFNPGDSLIGISMFFNRSADDANRKYFKLAVWNEVEGKPGQLIYSQEGARASLENGLTGFDFFKLDTAKAVPSVFYIGWQQVTPDFLNVGFDRNTNRKEKIFYKLAQTWKNTSFDGSLMIRPVFSNKSKKSSSDPELDLSASPEVKMWPNPMSDQLFLDYPQEWQDAEIRIIDLSGRTLIQIDQIQSQIPVNELPQGTYFIQIQKGRKRITQKMIRLND